MGAASFAAFSIGTLLPLLPYLLGVSLLEVAVASTAVGWVASGTVVGRLAGRALIRSSLRQLRPGASPSS